MQHIGFCSRPMNGIPPTGDGFTYVNKGAITRLMLADGIGHGTPAHQIVERLIAQFQWLSARAEGLPTIGDCLFNFDRHLKRLMHHDAQAAIAIVDIDRGQSAMSAAAVGNIEISYFCSGKEQHFAPMQGMVSGRMPSTLSLHRRPLEPPSIIAMTTDGIHKASASATLRSLSSSSSLMVQSAHLVAANIVESAYSPYDDASCALIIILQ